MSDPKGKSGRADGRYPIIHASPAYPYICEKKARVKDFNRSGPLVCRLKEASDGLLCAAVRFIREGEAGSILSDKKRALETYCPFTIAEIDSGAFDSHAFSDLAGALERYDAALRRLGMDERDIPIGLLEHETLIADPVPHGRSMAKTLFEGYLASKAEVNPHTAFSEASRLIAILIDGGIDQAIAVRLVASAALRGAITIDLPGQEDPFGFSEDEIPTKSGGKSI